MKARIVTLGGDGIGPEVVAEAQRVLSAIGERFGHTFEFCEQLIGGAAIDETEKPLPEETFSACKEADAILLGAVGGPKWDDPQANVRPEQGLLALRQGLDLYANLRPIKTYPRLVDVSPLRAERLADVDFVVVRELTGGLYFGQPRLREEVDGVVRAVDTLSYTDREIRRVVRLAFEIAGKRKKVVTSIDKANVLESSRLWRQTASAVSMEFSEVRLQHQLVDSAAMLLITEPTAFDVIVTENMFGDILTDEASVLSGSLGLLPSASLSERRCGLYEPIHGSAPSIAGRGVANPIAAILSAAMLLNYSLDLANEADVIERAVRRAIERGARTADLGGSLSTRQMTDAVIEGIPS